jgi:hypothetical protein
VFQASAEPGGVRDVVFAKEAVMMTPTLTSEAFTPEAFAALGAPALVYVRPVKASEIMHTAPDEALEIFRLDPDQTLYAVHRADGARLAVLTDRDSAYAAAFANELAPVSVH